MYKAAEYKEMKQEVRFTVILSLTKKVSVRMLGWVKSEKIGFF